MSKSLMRSGLNSLVKGMSFAGKSAGGKKNKKRKRQLGDSVASGSDETLISSGVPRSMTTMFPDVLRVTLKNDFVINWTGTAGANNGFQCLANGLHLPLSSGPISGASPVAVGTANSLYGLGNLLTTTGPLIRPQGHTSRTVFYVRES